MTDDPSYLQVHWEVHMNKIKRNEQNAMAQLPELETVCIHCKGEGRYSGGRKSYRCEACDGAGYTPTEFGAKVLALMRHNFHPLYEDEKTADQEGVGLN
jgi:hypothetical protein